VAVGLVPIAINAPEVTATTLNTFDCGIKEVVDVEAAPVISEVPIPTALCAIIF
jgi:hypothetical protein